MNRTRITVEENPKPVRVSGLYEQIARDCESIPAGEAEFLEFDSLREAVNAVTGIKLAAQRNKLKIGPISRDMNAVTIHSPEQRTLSNRKPRAQDEKVFAEAVAAIDDHAEAIPGSPISINLMEYKREGRLSNESMLLLAEYARTKHTPDGRQLECRVNSKVFEVFRPVKY